MGMRGRVRAAFAVVLVAGGLAAGSAGGAAPKRIPATEVELTIAASRTTAASGQVIVFTGGGCDPGGRIVNLSLFSGSDPDVLVDYEIAVGDYVRPASDGSYEVELGLLANTGDGRYLPLPEGAYVAVAWCVAGDGWVRSPSVPITVSGAMPSQDLVETVDRRGGTFDLDGASCTEPVSLAIRGAGDENPGDEQSVDTTVKPDGSGDWAFHWDGPKLGTLLVQASCGDERADGFRYRLVIAEIVYDPEVPSTSTTATSTTSSTTTSTAPAPAAGSGGAAAPAAAPIATSPTYAG